MYPFLEVILPCFFYCEYKYFKHIFCEILENSSKETSKKSFENWKIILHFIFTCQQPFPFLLQTGLFSKYTLKKFLLPSTPLYCYAKSIPRHLLPNLNSDDRRAPPTPTVPHKNIRKFSGRQLPENLTFLAYCEIYLCIIRHGLTPNRSVCYSISPGKNDNNNNNNETSTMGAHTRPFWKIPVYLLSLCCQTEIDAHELDSYPAFVGNNNACNIYIPAPRVCKQTRANFTRAPLRNYFPRSCRWQAGVNRF